MTRSCKHELETSSKKTLNACVRKLLHIGVLAVFVAATDSVVRADSHGIAMHGEPELGTDFTHLPYANPNAPKGGSITFGEVGTFDSLNPFIIKGSYPWELRGQSFESLLARNYDEPFALYGLLAERIETAEDRSWVEFTLRERARFSDGAPVTVDDVIWSMETLGTKGRPNYRNIWKKVAEVERIGERGVRFHFGVADREAALILGLMPVLKQADWDGRDFAATTLTPIIGSGPYVVGAMEAGRSITLVRNKAYWGTDLPINRGRNNLDEIRIEYFRDGAAMFEAFKAGETDVFRDGDAARWAGHVFHLQDNLLWGSRPSQAHPCREYQTEKDLAHGELLQEPADVVRKEQQQRYQAGRVPQPAPPAAQSCRIDADAVDTAARGRAIEHPECPAQTRQRGGAEPRAPRVQGGEIGDPGTADTHQDQHQGHDTTHGRANSRDRGAQEGR